MSGRDDSIVLVVALLLVLERPRKDDDEGEGEGEDDGDGEGEVIWLRPKAAPSSDSGSWRRFGSGFSASGRAPGLRRRG